MKASLRQSESAKLWQKAQYANLVRFVPSGMYFARLRVAGKLIRKSLMTDKVSVAQLLLADLQKEERKNSESGRITGKGRMTFGDALAAYKERGYRPARPRNQKDGTTPCFTWGAQSHIGGVSSGRFSPRILTGGLGTVQGTDCARRVRPNLNLSAK